MVDLARQAFTTNNFGLAAELYERIIKEQGPNTSVFLGLADSYARSGNLRRAIDVYKIAFRVGRINPDHLSHLITSLVEMMEKTESTLNAQNNKTLDIFECGVCKSLWKDPITTICGHTFCRTCLLKEPILTQCNVCNTSFVSGRNPTIKTSVILQNLIEKWFPLEIHAAELKDKGNGLFKEQCIKEAIDAYSEAIKLCQKDHLLLGNRSHAYAATENFTLALEDADRAIQLRPDWAKGYYRKGIALTGLRKHEEAAYAFVQCLLVDPSVATAKSALAKSLHRILSPSPEDDVKSIERQRMLHPSSLTFLLEHSTPASSSSPTPNPGASAAPSPDILGDLQASLERQIRNINQEAQSSQQYGEQSQQSSQEYKQHSQRRESLPESQSSSLSSLHQRSLSDSSVASCSHSTSSGNNPATSLNQNEQTPPHRAVSAATLKADELECALCFRLLYEPVTTTCGHTFCLQCLDRCLDHRPSCPLCKSSLIQMIATRERKTSFAISQILETYFPESYEKRKAQHEQEMLEMSRMVREGCRDLPIFVCTLAFPSIQCPLHVFEPRYRLMVRQVMAAGTRQFGMCICLEGNEDNFSNYGTLLEVQNVQYLPDGRSVVSTVGGMPFKVLSRGKRDGYNTAEVEILRDNTSELNEAQKQGLLSLCTTVHTECKNWITSLPPGPRARIQQHLGAFPEPEQDLLSLPNGPAWAWHMVAMLPLDPRAQLTILAMTSLEDRLLAIRRVVNFASRKQSQ